MANEAYYVDNDLEITLECERDGASIDLSNVTTSRIYYKKPGGTTGFWNATVSGTTLVYAASAANIDTAGTWYLHAYVVDSGGEIWQGDTVDLEIRKEWQYR